MPDDKIEELREHLKRDISFDKKQELRKELIRLIKENSLVKFDSGLPVEYSLTYDTFSGTLEPIYFWTLDFLRGDDPSGLGFEVDKLGEDFEASSGGGFFGELGSRATVMQDRAMNILGKVNDVLRTIINLIYDLKEFEMRIQAYDDADSDKRDIRTAGEYSLKGIWMDQVDTRTGLGSINQLARGDLQFVTLRDAFLQAQGKTKQESLSIVKKMDLNKRVKIILEKKLEEYYNWRNSSKMELKKRYDIEKNYLRSQVDSLKIYTNWARPYLRAAQKLKMAEFTTRSNLPSPDMVAAFNTMQMELKLMGKKKIKPESVHPSYQKIKFKDDYYSCVEVQFMYRTAPQVMRQGQSQQYGHMGTVEVFMRAYVFNNKDLEDIYNEEVYEDLALVEQLTGSSLKSLQQDIDYYLHGDENKKEEKKKDNSNILSDLFDGFRFLDKSLKSIRLIPSEKTAGGFQEEQVKKAAQEKAKGSCFTLYDVFKKAHRMVTW